MIYRPLGKTGKEISAISFGGMRFRAEDYNKDHQICADILLRAHELGINYFDTAPGYCDNQSQKIVGLAMRQIRGTRPYVSTKCGLWMAKTADEAYVRVQKACDTLSVDKIDFYYMWCVRTLDEYRQLTTPGGVYDGLVRAQQDGLIGHICTSVHVDSADIGDIVADGKAEAILLGYNALNSAYRGEGLRACQKAGLGVVVMNPLGGGLIPRQAEKFDFLKNTPDETIVQAALRFVIGHEAVTAALPGPGSIQELEECVSAVENAYTVTEETRSRVASHLKQELNALCTSCAYCEPCPSGVPIVKLLDAYNQYLLGRNVKELPNALEEFWGISAEDAAQCTACGLCEPLCTQKLPIIERLREIAAWTR
ncbi:MAG: aldo/keto reductase [Oscillospiraceae bacterium]|nr:aldo/keto reductase [Oscillospiraceae bacterium]